MDKDVLLLLCLLTLLVSCGRDKSVTPQHTLFNRLAASETGIEFVNTFEETQEFNLFTYRNIYNGGGVAIGDVNRDSMLDVYFTSNQGSNRLYLNEGNFQFKDITESAGVSGDGFWSTGVSMADVNADGLLDIYVLNSGPGLSGRNNRRNELFINQGKLRFKEEAKKYNLDDNAYSVHAAFFDYDGDGDLDCYLLNNAYTGSGGNDMQKYASVTRRGQSETGGDKLFRNDGGEFVDVSKEAGIYRGGIGFGLGIAVGDVNGDIRPDIYISNDFWERDYLYINQGDGTFAEELNQATGHISRSSMGNEIGDINNDGVQDIYATDMLPTGARRTKTMTKFDRYVSEDEAFFGDFHFQYVHNTLQLNNGNGAFREAGFLYGVAMTDWSWAAMMFDFDNNGWKDIFVTNGVYRDITDKSFYEEVLNRKTIARIVRESGEFNVFDFLDRIPSKKIVNFAFVNDEGEVLRQRSDSLGFDEPSFSNGAAYGDLDNDGDLDLMISNIENRAFVYENRSEKYFDNHYLKVKLEGGGDNPYGVGAHVQVFTSGSRQVAEHIPARSFQSTVAPYLHFGLGKETRVDSLVVVWPNHKMQVVHNVEADQEIVLNQNAANLRFTFKSVEEEEPVIDEVTERTIVGRIGHAENKYIDYHEEPLLPHMLSDEGPDLVVGDVNGDNLDDFYISGSMDTRGKVVVQKEDGTFHQQKSPDFELEEYYESAAAALLDIEGDGDLDLMVAPGGNQYAPGSDYYRVRVYKNNGKSVFSLAMQAGPDIRINASAIRVDDFDGDGDSDVFIGARLTPKHYGVDPRSYLLRNDGSGNWTDVTPEQLKRPGMITDAVWSDNDGDGDNDLLVAGEWMPIMLFENQGGALQYEHSVEKSHGWWTRIKEADLDGDGDPDFVLGNWGLNSKFDASFDRPMSMYVKDFDGNGTPEFVINTYLSTEEYAYPFHTYDDLIKVLPELQGRVENHRAYAGKTYEELFSRDQREGARRKEVYTLHSSLLLNEEEGFELRELPLEAQIAPVYGIIVEDLRCARKVEPVARLR